jgi:hypothetical protein
MVSAVDTVLPQGALEHHGDEPLEQTLPAICRSPFRSHRRSVPIRQDGTQSIKGVSKRSPSIPAGFDCSPPARLGHFP